MPPNVLARRIDALRNFARRLADENAGGVLGDALDAVVAATAARAGVAFGVDGTIDPIAERGVLARGGHDAASIKRVLHRLASHAATTRRTMIVLDARRELVDVHEAAELSASGIHAIQVEPVLCRRSVLGVLLALFDEAALLDEDTQAYIAGISGLSALGLDTQRRIEQERGDRERWPVSGAADVGLLSAALAHEVKAPTAALLVQWEEQQHTLEQLTHLAGPADSALGSLVAELGELGQEMGVALSRLRDTSERLLSMGKRETSHEHVDLAGVARRSLGAVGTLIEQRGIPVEEHYDEGCLTLGRRDELEQVVLNLLLNALEAAAERPEPRIWLSVQTDGNNVSLLVEDTGPGVPPDQVEAIFQPFYTTKAHGRGAGLGLKIVREVVVAHRGHIEVHGRRGGGASFRVVLPRVTAQAGNVFNSPVPQRSGSPVRQVFAVDDEPMFSRALRRGLKPHVVRTAASASEAEMVLLDPGYHPDLIVCDVFLPGANGDVLHQRIKARRPDLAARFVFVTGAALGKDEANYLKNSGCLTLLKPIDLAQLRTLLGPRDAGESSPPVSVRTLSDPTDSDLPTAIPPERR